MTNWLKLDPGTTKCCAVEMMVRNGRNPFAKEGGQWECPKCGKSFVRIGDEIKEQK